MNTRYRFLILLLPPLAALLLYLPALHGGLVWDDPLFLYHPLYRQPVNWARVLSSPFVLSPNYFRPLVVATFVLGGLTPRVPQVVPIIVEAATSEGPFGAKGVGEITSIPTAPAIINAIHAATGVRITELPARPERMQAAFEVGPGEKGE